MLPPPGFTPVLEPLPQPSATSLLSAALASATALSISVTPPQAPSAFDPSNDGSASMTGPYLSASPPPEKCKLLGNFAIFVQIALGAVALSSLVWKRYRESPKRPYKVFLFDASKQGIGSSLVHITNVYISEKLLSGSSVMLGSQGMRTPNPCTLYLLNLAIDTTIGIWIAIFFYRLFTRMFSFCVANPLSIKTGNYDDPPRYTWWMKQCGIYFLSLWVMKVIVILMLKIPLVVQIGDWALKWTEGNVVVQILFVMFVFPVTMNAFQFYVLDGYIKDSSESTVTEGATGDEEEAYREPAEGGEGAEGEDGKLLKKAKAKPTELRTGEYDPQYDGEDSPSTASAPTLVGSSRGSGA